MEVLCDTNVLIRMHGRADDAAARLRSLGVTRLLISTVSYGEFLGGVSIRRKREAHKFLRDFEVIPFDDSTQRTAHYLAMRHKLKPKQGADFLIACVARAKRLAVLTENVRDFKYGGDVWVVAF